MLMGAPSAGVNVLVDPVGGMHFDAGLKCMARGGRVLLLGFASGRIPKVPANILLVKNLEAHGVYWGSYLNNDPVPLQRSMQQLMEWWAEGRIRVHTSHRLVDPDVSFATRRHGVQVLTISLYSYFFLHSTVQRSHHPIAFREEEGIGWCYLQTVYYHLHVCLSWNQNGHV